MAQKIIRTGNSAALTIPKDFFQQLGLKIGDAVEVEFDARHGRITYKFLSPRQLKLTRLNRSEKS